MVYRALADDLGLRKSTMYPISRFCSVSGGSATSGRISEIGGLDAVASAVRVSEFVEGRHAGTGQPAFDGHHDGVTIEVGFAQIGPVRHLAVHLAAVPCPAMACLTIRLLAKQPRAFRDIARVADCAARPAVEKTSYRQPKRGDRPAPAYFALRRRGNSPHPWLTIITSFLVASRAGFSA